LTREDGRGAKSPDDGRFLTEPEASARVALDHLLGLT
jgi:hypothetical protein